MGTAGALHGRDADSVPLPALDKRTHYHEAHTRITIARWPDGRRHRRRPSGADLSREAADRLVHGAFADGSSWERVIPILQRDGYKVIAVQNPLASLAGDVETTKRVIDAQTGPVVVVGHSYGGAVITEAAAGNPNVSWYVLRLTAALGADRHRRRPATPSGTT